MISADNQTSENQCLTIKITFRNILILLFLENLCNKKTCERYLSYCLQLFMFLLTEQRINLLKYKLRVNLQIKENATHSSISL